MKIADLKQPYRRMAEYLVTQNCIQEAGDGIYNFYKQGDIMDLFCNAIDEGHNPPITEEIKKHFPPDFDFSGEEIKTKPVMQILDTETQKTIYTQLAKEGKFDNLPDTCEFSEVVELEVWDDVISSEKNNHHTRLVIGKFKNKFIASTSTGYCSWNYAQLPTPKIDFSQFKSGDVVEVEQKEGVYFYGEIRLINKNSIKITASKVSEMATILDLEEIKSITKIK